MPSWARFVVADSVSTFMSGDTVIMHDGVSCGPRPLSTSTRHMRHMPTAHPVVPAEAGDVLAVALGGGDDQLALAGRDRSAVERDGDGVGIGFRLDGLVVGGRGVGGRVVDGRRGGRLGGFLRRAALARLRVVRHACAPATAATGSGASMTVSGIRVRGLIWASNSLRNSVSAEWTGT